MKRGSAVALAVFAAQLAGLELVLHGGAWAVAHPRALLAFAASAALLVLLARAARRAWVVAVVAVSVATLVVCQLAYFRFYHAPIDAQVAGAARAAWSDVRPMLLRAVPQLLLGALLLAPVEAFLLVRAREASGRVRPVWLALACALGWLGAPAECSTETRLAASLAALAAPPPARAATAHAEVPVAVSRRARLPSVLLVVTESVRAGDGCAASPCAASPELDAALPDRVPLREHRALASYTALSLGAILGGVVPARARPGAPDLFDFARSVRGRGGERPSVRYLSAHYASVLDRADLRSALDQVVTGEDLLGRPLEDIEDAVAAGLDRRLADACEASLGKDDAPVVAVVHPSGTHAPYFFDEARAPFAPWKREVTWSGLPGLHNAYLDAILEQDRSLARCVRAFVAARAGAPWLVLYTSDHGEAFGEHGAIHHGQSLYDEQVHVPGFVAFGGGALGPDEAAALRASERAFTTHVDVLPTILDALGVLDHFALASRVAALDGRSLLRPAAPAPSPLPITNCTEVFPCPVRTWGLLAGDRKLVAQPWDGAWRCLRLEGGEREVEPSACTDLLPASRAAFPTMPNGTPN
jgi:hypothetical protein